MFGPPLSPRPASSGFPITPPSQSCPVSFGARGVGEPARLERDEALLPEIDGLLELPRLQVPKVDPLPVAAGLHVGEVEPRLIRVRLNELARDEGVLPGLVPEVV